MYMCSTVGLVVSAQTSAVRSLWFFLMPKMQICVVTVWKFAVSIIYQRFFQCFFEKLLGLNMFGNI